MREWLAWLKRSWDKSRPFLIIKSAEGSRSFPGNVTHEEYEAWRDRMDKKGIKRIRGWANNA